MRSTRKSMAQHPARERNQRRTMRLRSCLPTMAFLALLPHSAGAGALPFPPAPVPSNKVLPPDPATCPSEAAAAALARWNASFGVGVGVGVGAASARATLSDPVPGAGAGLKLGLCTMVLMEYENAYIASWVAHHHMIGFDHFWVWVDWRRAEPSNTSQSVLQLLVDSGLVTVLNASHSTVQGSLGGHCAQLAARRGFSWSGFWDGDEYAFVGPGVYRVHRGAETGADANAPLPDVKAWLAARFPAAGQRPGGRRRTPLEGLQLPRFNFHNAYSAETPAEISGSHDHIRPDTTQSATFTAAEMTLQSPCPGKTMTRLVAGKRTYRTHSVHSFSSGPTGKYAMTNGGVTKTIKKSAHGSCAVPIHHTCHRAKHAYMTSYQDLRLFHFITRSVTECETKMANHAKGIRATKVTHVGWRGLASRNGMCNTSVSLVLHDHALAQLAPRLLKHRARLFPGLAPLLLRIDEQRRRNASAASGSPARPARQV